MPKDKETNVPNEDQPTFTLEDVKKLIDQAVAEAVAGVKEESFENVKNRSKNATVKKRNDSDDLVTIKISPTREAKDDVFLSINDETCIIKRGQNVKVKKKFARMYENSRLQEEVAIQYMEQRQSESLAKLDSANM